jgi:hypothetical protein
MLTERKNLFKELDRFLCVHDVHQHFKAKMSTYHILIEKNCYPNGCVYFQWKCRLLAKQKKCFRNFKTVGRKCFNCRYFYEEKIHQYPEFISDEGDFKQFYQRFEDFLEWVNALKSGRVTCEGKVSSVIPSVRIEIQGNNKMVKLSGFLVTFLSGYLNETPFDDRFYLSISRTTQNQLRFHKDDLVEFEASLQLDKGRFKFIKSGKFHFIERGADYIGVNNNMIHSIHSATIQNGQPEKCLQCSKGILADMNNNNGGPKRAMVCLLGMPDHQLCSYKDGNEKKSGLEQCANPGWNLKKCRRTLT